MWARVASQDAGEAIVLRELQESLLGPPEETGESQQGQAGITDRKEEVRLQKNAPHQCLQH